MKSIKKQFIMSKKAILSTVFTIALVAVAGFGINKSVNNNINLNDLALANVEALANGEIDFPWLCQQTSPKVCIIDMGTMYLGKRLW